MAKEEKSQKKVKNVKLTSKAISGSKFEDLSEKQMEELQGQGDTRKKAQSRGILDIFTSEGKYNCR